MSIDTKPSRGDAMLRGCLCRCPRCGEPGLLRSYFKLHDACPHCGLSFEKEEGFTLGTTSIGYVVSIVVILIPMIALALMDVISTFTAIAIGGVLSITFPIVMYPWFLGMVVGSYFALFGYEDL